MTFPFLRVKDLVLSQILLHIDILFFKGGQWLLGGWWQDALLINRLSSLFLIVLLFLLIVPFSVGHGISSLAHSLVAHTLCFAMEVAKSPSPSR